MPPLKEIVIVWVNGEKAPRSPFYVSVYPGIHVLKSGNPDLTVRKYLYEIVSHVLRWDVWYVSDCSALLWTLNERGEFYVRSNSTKRVVNVGNVKIFISPLEKDFRTRVVNGLLGIRSLVPEQAVLANLRVPKSNPWKILPYEKVVHYVKSYGNSLNPELLEEIADSNKYLTAKERFFEIYRKLRGSEDISPDERSLILKSQANGEDVDHSRIEAFRKFLTELAFAKIPEKKASPRFEIPDYLHVFSFFESYFSNYIEGTVFTVEDAKKIVEKGESYDRPNNDTHNVLDLYRFLRKFYGAYVSGRFKEPSSYEEFRELVKSMHKAFTYRSMPEIAGNFKTANNRNASGYVYVSKEKLEGTLRAGFEMSAELDSATKKALFLHYVVSECHPFQDGNGRLSRLVMNYYLVLDGRVPAIITEKFRTAYLRALWVLSRERDSSYYIAFFRSTMAKMESLDFSGWIDENELSKEAEEPWAEWAGGFFSALSWIGRW